VAAAPGVVAHRPACIRQAESGNGTTSRNVYGMLDGWAQADGHGSAAAASRAEQDYRAWLLWCWARRTFGDGYAAWHPYDGC